MYVSDHELRELLPELAIRTDKGAHGFDPATQIQPCSIDLRISNVFWKPSRSRRLWRRIGRRSYAVDLRHSQAHDLEPLRDWKPYRLGEGETLTVKPGQVLMARIYERFKVPGRYAGKIEGRSSFARLGLAVHCTGDFINPGWEGYMPLQLVNCGPYPIRITPYLPVCQLMLVPLSSEPEHTYGDPELKSKYENDDGGPSKWWRDQSIRDLQTRLGEVHATERMQQQIIERVRFADVEVLERFQRYVADRRIREIENVDELLDGFARKEDRRRLIDRIAVGSFPVFFATALASLFVPFSPAHVALLLATIVSAFLAFRSYVRLGSGYLGTKEVREARAVRPNREDDTRGG